MPLFTQRTTYIIWISLLLSLLHLTPATAQTRWARQAGGDGGQQINCIAVDGSANVYLIGSSKGVATFDTITVGKADVAAHFIAKYTAQGKASWVHTITGSILFKVAVDAADNVYVVGSFSGTVALGGVTLASRGTGDLLLMKYDPQGTVLWARAGGSAPGNWLSGQALALDAAGNVYVGGGLGGTAYPGGSAGTLTSAGKYNIMFAKYTSQGQPVWMRQGGGSDGARQPERAGRRCRRQRLPGRGIQWHGLVWRNQAGKSEQYQPDFAGEVQQHRRVPLGPQ
ncbi:MAG: hypothetical protein WKG07_28110 [Hymenobacter sp.]